MKVHVNCNEPQALVTIVSGSFVISAHNSSLNIVHCEFLGSGITSRSVERSAQCGERRQIGRLTCNGEPDQKANADDHKHDIQHEVLVVVHGDAIGHPWTVACEGQHNDQDSQARSTY